MKVLSQSNGATTQKRNQGGFTTVEFLFAIVIAFGLTMMTFAMTTSLSVVEVTQYIAYSSSRAHAAANFDVEAQQKSARDKYSLLINSVAMAPLYKNGWFEISPPAQLDIRSGNGKNFEREYGGDNPFKNMQGLRTNLRVKILEMKWPLLGSINPEDDGVGFSTKINAILLREVSQAECHEFMKERAQQLWTFDGKNRFAKFKKDSRTPAPWEDNGC